MNQKRGQANQINLVEYISRHANEDKDIKAKAKKKQKQANQEKVLLFKY